MLAASALVVSLSLAAGAPRVEATRRAALAAWDARNAARARAGLLPRKPPASRGSAAARGPIVVQASYPVPGADAVAVPPQPGAVPAVPPLQMAPPARIEPVQPRVETVPQDPRGPVAAPVPVTAPAALPRAFAPGAPAAATPARLVPAAPAAPAVPVRPFTPAPVSPAASWPAAAPVPTPAPAAAAPASVAAQSPVAAQPVPPAPRHVQAIAPAAAPARMLPPPPPPPPPPALAAAEGSRGPDAQQGIVETVLRTVRASSGRTMPESRTGPPELAIDEVRVAALAVRVETTVVARAGDVSLTFTRGIPNDDRSGHAAPPAAAPTAAPVAPAAASAVPAPMPAAAPAATLAPTPVAAAPSEAAAAPVPIPEAPAFREEPFARDDAAPAAGAPVLLARIRTPAGVSFQRFLDRSGQIKERILDLRGRVVDERVVASITDLPIVTQRRVRSGRIVQVVRDDSGILVEVLRDPIGRLLDARILERRPTGL